MKAKTLYSLIAAALIALIAAWWVSSAQKPASETAGNPSQLLPGFREQINDVDTITLSGAESKILATLKRGSTGWTIAEKSGYPADLTKLREFLLKLADAAVLEQKTANPKLYATLGVTDVKEKEAAGVLVVLVGQKLPVRLVIGNFNGGGGGGTFVRRDGEAQALLVKGNLSVEKTAAGWEKKDLADIAAARLKQIILTGTDGKVLKVYKDQAGDANFKVADVPKGREVSSDFVANALGSMLAGLRADDVFAAKDMAPAEKVYKAKYLAFDGLNVDAVGWVKDGKDYAQFSATLDDAAAAASIDAEQARAKAEYEAGKKDATPKAAEKTDAADKKPDGATADAKPASIEPPAPLAVTDPAKDKAERLKTLHDEVAALNKTFSGWTFVLPAYKFGNIDKGMDDMLKPLESKTGKPAAGKPATAKPPANPAPAAAQP